ncbi:MAG: NlpC-P60 family protein, partial [Coxiellaceae bacterium]|nr:NlpC-P60 family protein [Coxiellaceae bacterium]
PTTAIAPVDDRFAGRWARISNKKLAAITRNHVVFRGATNHFLSFEAYIGAVYPVMSVADKEDLLFPVRGMNGYAQLAYMKLPEGSAVVMPYSPTPHHFANMMKRMIGRPYGWGGIYFYNDCPQELKSLYATFGIWLPRHSSNQVTISNMHDESSLSTSKRIQYLLNNGHPFMTIVYVGGHVFQYIGQYDNPNDPQHKPMAMTYQNVWGLSPKSHLARSVIGESVLFPLLKTYPEDNALISLAGKTYFQVAFLDEPMTTPMSFGIQSGKVNLRSLMMP